MISFMNWYRIKTSFIGIKRLITLSKEDKQACINEYKFFQRIKLMPAWVEESLDLLQTGGQSWTDAEKAKIADLNWRIVAEKPAANF